MIAEGRSACNRALGHIETQAESPEAATWATAANSLATTLKVSANVQMAVELVLSTATLPPGKPCAVSAGGGADFRVNLDNVNGSGVDTPTCGSVTAATASNATDATHYRVTPSYSGFTATTATVSLTAPASTCRSRSQAIGPSEPRPQENSWIPAAHGPWS